MDRVKRRALLVAVVAGTAGAVALRGWTTKDRRIPRIPRTPCGPRELLWKVWLKDAPGSPPVVARLRYMSAHETRDAARCDFAKRQRALRAAGYERVE
jgi:hypothetical protein